MKTKCSTVTVLLAFSAVVLCSCGRSNESSSVNSSAKSSVSSRDNGVCSLVQAKLGAVAGATLKKTGDTFTLEGKKYTGCVFRVSGEQTDTVDGYATAYLLYPEEGSALHKEGWRVSGEADGPDGTAFKISRGQDFCQVNGSWDGGDDSDPQYVPSKKFEVVVMCGTGK